MARALDVGADGDAVRLAGVAHDAQLAGDRTLGAGRHHHQPGVDRVGAAANAGGPAAVVEHDRGLGFEPDVGSRRRCGVDQGGIEPPARPHGAVTREASTVGPRQLPPPLAGDHPQAVDEVGTVERDLELVERRHRPRCQPVAAHLVATMGALLEHDDLGAVACGADRRRRAGRAAADHGNVTALGHEQVFNLDLLRRSARGGGSPRRR